MDLIFSHLSFMALVYVTACNNVKRYFSARYHFSVDADVTRCNMGSSREK